MGRSLFFPGGLSALVDNRWKLPRGLTYEPSGEGFCILARAQEGSAPVVVRTDDLVFHAIGARWEGKIYAGGRVSCAALVAPPAIAYFAIGAPVEAEAVARIVLVGRGTGRLALKVVESEGRGVATEGLSLGHGVYVDNKRTVPLSQADLRLGRRQRRC